MRPNSNYITIPTSKELIADFLQEVVISPRSVMRKRAKVTNQTPAAKLGYVGQHLASLITGVPGTGTGARGDDLADKSEVKSCNKVDQVDKCKKCGGRVMRMQSECPYCHSSYIERKEDSKWLFSIRDEHELQQYKELDRIILLLFDYPQFSQGVFHDIRIRSFEIYPQEERMNVFCKLIDNHYYNIYLPKISRNLKTNPMNLHPDKFQFFMCNPIKTFECIIKDIDSKPKIQIQYFLLPNEERGTNVKSEMMPINLLKNNEIKHMLNSADFEGEVFPLLVSTVSKEELKKVPFNKIQNYLPYIDENLRKYIPLRDIVSIRQHTPYQRG